MERDETLKDMRAAFDAGLKGIAPGSEAAKAYEGSIDWIDSQSGGTTEVTAVPANDFVERISVQTHLNWRDTVWGSKPEWRDQFKNLGARYTRSHLGTSQPAMTDLRYIGAKLIVVIDDHDSAGNYNTTKAQKGIDFAAQNADVIHAIEGPNEPNAGNPSGWADKVRDYCEWLSDAVAAKPELRDKPVIGPSMWGRETAAYNELGDISDSMDVGNLHYYTGGRPPPVSGFPDSYNEGGDPDKTYTLDDAIREAQIISPGRPTWITEVGWPVAGPNVPLDAWNCSDLAQAKYNVRMLCESYIRDIGMTGLYTLIDDVRSPPYYHGMLKQDLSKRLCFDALKRTIGIFADDGTPPPAGGLAYTAEDNPKVKALPLMRKKNGAFLLGFWQDQAESYNRSTCQDQEIAPQFVALDFGGKQVVIRTTTPTIGTAWTSKVTTAKFTAPVPDHLLVVEVTAS